MFKLIKRLKFFFAERKMRKVCSSLQVSEKGKCLIKYLEDIVLEKDVYNAAYEECLQDLLADGMSRIEAAKFQLAMFQILKIYGAEDIDINL